MADKRITELTALAQAGVDVAQDQLAIADVSASETKKISPAELVSAGAAGLAPGSIDGSAIIDNTITAQQLASGSVTSAELAPDSVTFTAIQQGAVRGGPTGELALATVTADNLADGSVTSARLGPNAVTGSKIAPGAINGAIHIQAASITSAELGPDSVTDVELADGAVDTASIQQNAVTGGLTGSIGLATVTADNLADGSVDGNKIAAGAVDSAHIAAGALDSTHIGTGFEVDTANIADDAITPAKIADGAVNSTEIAAGALNSTHIGPTFEVDTANISNGAVTASKIANGAVGSSQIALTSIDATHIAPNSLGASVLASDSVGASELADNSVDTSAILDGAVTTPKIDNGAVTNEKLASGIDGSKLVNGSVDTNQIADGAITDNKIVSVSLSKLPNAPAGTVLAGPVAGASASPAFRSIVATDLPTATTAAKGAISIAAAGGLSITGDALSIGNTVTANSAGAPVVTYDSNGLITGFRGLQSSELPVATSSSPGAVLPGNGLSIAGNGALSIAAPTPGGLGGVKAGNDIQIDVDGTIHQADSGVVPGEYTKVTTNARGNIVSATNLTAADIPQLDFSKIENVSINGNQLVDESIQQRHLAPDSVTVVGDQAPPLKGTALYANNFGANPGGDPVLGTFWFDNDVDRLYVWEGTKWNAVFEDLSQNNLRYGGNIDADTGLITVVNSYGSSAGYAVGEALRTASKDTVGLYFVVDTPTGSGPGFTVSQLGGIHFDAGDWVLASIQGQAGTDDGWRHINAITTGGGGGGGGALTNHTLFGGVHPDVVAPQAPVAGELIRAVDVGGSIQWQNTAEIDCGSNDYA